MPALQVRSDVLTALRMVCSLTLIDCCYVDRTELRGLEDAEAEEVERKQKALQAKQREFLLHACFVDGLEGDQFFDSLFAGDENAEALLAADRTGVLVNG